MSELAFATCRNWSELSDDDRLVAGALRAKGVNVSAIVWNAPNVEWSRFKCVVIRSTWDYHLMQHEYAEWVRKFSGDGPCLWNPPEVVLQNMDKRYLSALATKGLRTVPTAYLAASAEISLRDVLIGRDWNDVVIKPAVSAAGYGTWRTSLPLADRDQTRFAEQISRRDLLMQPYMPEVASQGEWSFIFLAGQYSHAVLKRPAAGDFRVQREFGGSSLAAKAPTGLIEDAKFVVSTIKEELLYARVDGIERNGRLILMELELIEPFLYLGFSEGAIQRFAEAIYRRI
jgi:glutathione synthase/RimK-type ligase-like ATP-grasp enzyme